MNNSLRLHLLPERQEIKYARRLICLGLAAICLMSFWQVQTSGFVHYDDAAYVTANAHVREGLTAQAILWASTALDVGFWQPITWLSLMADYQAYRMNPGGYHWTNLLLHIANTLILFLILQRMTLKLGRSAFVAVLFAVHPLHVESVAWIAQRKDVLSTFFWMLTLLAYVHYVTHPNIKRYLLVVVAFLLGLGAKPMLVTLPITLFLLDYWPLNRFRKGSNALLFWEKLPLMVLSFVFIVLAFITESKIGALSSLSVFPLENRVAHALVSYVLYIKQMFCPMDLAVFYPRPRGWDAWQVAAASCLLLAVSALALRFRKDYPYLMVGWFWYLFTLVPVIGLVQIGSHAIADRYTYVSLIGLFLILSWGIPDGLRMLPYRKYLLSAGALLIMGIMMHLTWKQVQVWQSPQTLFQHALSVTENNFIAHNNLGAALSREGKTTEAIDHFQRAIAIDPKYAEAYFNMGVALADLGRYEEAMSHYAAALSLKPRMAEALNNMGVIDAGRGRQGNAGEYFRQALLIRPDYAEVRRNLNLLQKDPRTPPSVSGRRIEVLPGKQ